MASVDTEEISFKELTELVVHNELNEITAFKVVLNSFLQKHPLTEKLPVDEALKSATELISLVSVLRKHLKWFDQQYGVHLVGYATLEKMEKLYADASTFGKLLSLKNELDSGVEPCSPSPVDASSVAEFVFENTTSLKCSSCKKDCKVTDRKSQLTCRTIDVKRRYRQKQKLTQMFQMYIF